MTMGCNCENETKVVLPVVPKDDDVGNASSLFYLPSSNALYALRRQSTVKTATPTRPDQWQKQNTAHARAHYFGTVICHYYFYLNEKKSPGVVLRDK
jgi:hypothetical protein